MDPLFCSHRGYGLRWFRIFGYGLAIKDTTKARLFFSERNGLAPGLKIGKWYIRLLYNGVEREKGHGE